MKKGRRTRETNADLAREIRRGSADAVETVRARVRRIIGFRGYGIPAADRRDLEQETVTQIWQAVNRPSFDPALGFWGFVETVTARRCIDWLRASKPESLETREMEAPSASPLDDALTRERTRRANAALARLGGTCRELIYLRVGLNRSYRELARMLDTSEGALRVRLHRCIREARRILDERSGESPARDDSSETG